MTTTIPWVISDSDAKFQKQVFLALTLALVLCVMVSQIPLPAMVVATPEDKPRYAEIILPQPEPPAAAELPRPKPKAKVKPGPKPEPVIEKPQEIVAEVKQTVKQTVTEAREKAKLSGLLAFQDQLKAMRGEITPDAVQDTASLTRGAGQAARAERAILTSNSPSARRASVDVASLSNETGGVALSGRESTIVDAPVEEQVATGAVRLVKPDLNGVRSIEEVRRVFDANKGAIFSIYNRALRKDPNLLGKVVLELVIEPDGSVSTCDILASELTDEELLSRVMRRVRLFDFGARDVAVTKISYPVHFLPT